MKSLTENWFKIIISVLGVLYVCSLFLGRYIEIKSHNLDVLVQIRLCANAEGMSEKGEDQCANVAKQQAIPKDFYKKEGQGFE
jgi:type IV secretory pathway VirB6-like protein